MASIKHNLEIWGNPKSWKAGGEEWSEGFTGSDVQWYHFLLPRLQQFLPVKNILEIAPGYGRWTHFLKDRCDSLVGVDISQVAIENCRKRFAEYGHLEFHVNDGLDLSFVESGSIDLVFSFDALVHADCQVLEGYLLQFKRILKPDGLALVHHSNLKQFEKMKRWARHPRLQRLRPLLDAPGLYPRHEHFRDDSMSGALLLDFAKKANLSCISQEFLTWGDNRAYLDCISLITPNGSPYARPLRQLWNRDSESDRKKAVQLAKIYSLK